MVITIERKRYLRDWYIKNSKRHINNVRTRQKETNYSAEKTPKQRNIRYTKRRTRIEYPLFKALKCEFCNSGATEHHHYTNPIKINKFNYVCHPCHQKLNGDLRTVRGFRLR